MKFPGNLHFSFPVAVEVGCTIFHSCLPCLLCFTMNVNDQELSAFKVLLINDNLEEAKRIFTRKLDVFRNKIRTASDLILQNLSRDDFTCLIPADVCVNQVKGECFCAIKATANGDCLFNSSSIIILLHGNESLAILLRLLVTGELYFNAQFYCDHDASNGMKQRQTWCCESVKSKL